MSDINKANLFGDYISKMTGVKFNTKAKKLLPKDKKQELFESMIHMLELIISRSTTIEDHLGFTLESYDSIFYDYIKDSLEFTFGAEIREIISYYVENRLNSEEQSIMVEMNDGVKLQISNVQDLWLLIKAIEQSEENKSGHERGNQEEDSGFGDQN